MAIGSGTLCHPFYYIRIMYWHVVKKYLAFTKSKTNEYQTKTIYIIMVIVSDYSLYASFLVSLITFMSNKKNWLIRYYSLPSILEIRFPDVFGFPGIREFLLVYSGSSRDPGFVWKIVKQQYLDCGRMTAILLSSWRKHGLHKCKSH